jgi:hypothetical protein
MVDHNPGELTRAEEERILCIAERLEISPEQVTDLERIRDGFGICFDADEYSNDELLSLGIGYGISGPLTDEQIRREAGELLEKAE